MPISSVPKKYRSMGRSLVRSTTGLGLRRYSPGGTP